MKGILSTWINLVLNSEPILMTKVWMLFGTSLNLPLVLLYLNDVTVGVFGVSADSDAEERLNSVRT